MIVTTSLLEEIAKLDPPLRTAFIEIMKGIEKAIGDVVTRRDFLELSERVNRIAKAVEELAEAQIKSEERLSKVEKALKELAEAQKKTEERLNRLEEVVTELAEAQKKTEERLNRLEEVVVELAEAQKKTEERLNRLEEVVTELAEAQKKTEERLNKLIEEHIKTREQVGSLAHTVGYFLENEAYKYLPKLLMRDFGITVEGSLIRDYIEVSPNKYEEINIIGKGRKNGNEVIILGEAKTQLKKSHIDKFISLVKKIEKFYPSDKILIFVTHQTSPLVRDYANKKGVKIYFSYQFV